MTGRTGRRLAVMLAAVLAMMGVPAAPAAADPMVTIPDAGLRTCLLDSLNLGNTHELTEGELAGITHLVCWRNGWIMDQVRDLTGIGYLTGATSLVLRNQELTDLSPLAGLTKLKALSLDSCGITDASPLSGLTGLTYLDLSDNPVTDLRFTSSFGLLQQLQVAGVPADVSPIANLTSLKSLSLGGNSTSDYTFLTGLPALTELRIGADKETKLGPLGHPAALTKLTVQGDELTDVSSIAGLRSLHELTIDTPKVASLEPFAGLVNLSFLDVEASSVSDLHPISGLDSLHSLNLINGLVTDLSPVSGLGSLVTLDVSGNRVSSLPDFSGTSLTVLDVSNNQLSTMSIDGLGLLTNLYASQNQLTSLHLANLGNLASLMVDGNAFTSISLSNLPVLAKVDLSGNQLTLPGAYSNLPRLSALELSRNQITSLSGLAGLPALTDLDAAENQLTTLAQLADLKLTRLNASGNQLTNLGPVASLPLTVLNVSGNQLADLPTFTHAAGLAELDAAHNKLTTSTRLKGLPALATVDLSSNLLTNVSPLATLRALVTLTVSGNEIPDLSAFVGTSARIQADAQAISITENAPVGTPVPITLRGPDDKIPGISHDDTVTVGDGTLTYNAPGKHTVGFTQTVGESVFSGELTRVAGTNAVFTTVNTPHLTRSPSVGSPIEATAKAWTPVVDHYTYQWYRDGEAIADAKEQLYIPAAKDLGHRLKASVTGAKDGYLSVTTWTRISAKVARGTFKVTTPAITGSTRTGSQLALTVGQWSPTPSRYTYRWYRNGHPIKNATKITYNLTAADLGKHVSATVRGYGAAVTPRSSTSKRTRAVTEGPVTSAQPQITGPFQVGELLGVNRGVWGPGKITFRYQWLWDGNAIPNARASTYLFTAADSGHVLAVAVTGDRPSYTAVTRTSYGITVR